MPCDPAEPGIAGDALHHCGCPASYARETRYDTHTGFALSLPILRGANVTTADDILVENLIDALQQVQRYLLLGATSAALLLILTIDSPALLAAKDRVDVPTLGKINPDTAAFVFMVGYVVFGILANAALTRVRNLRPMIQDPDLATAALLRFSFVTADSAFVRASASLVPPLLMVLGLFAELFRTGGRPFLGQDVAYLILGALVICAPYLLLAAAVFSPLSASARNPVLVRNEKAD